MLGLVLILGSLLVVLHVFSELWWAGMTTPAGQGGVSDVLQWLPWDTGKRAQGGKQNVFPRFILSAGPTCTEAKPLRKGFLEEHVSSLTMAA